MDCASRYLPGSSNRGLQVSAALLVYLLATALAAQPAESSFDRLWSRARLYSGGSDSPVQSVVSSGRFQADLAELYSGDRKFSDSDLRRFRFGFRMDFRNRIRVHAEAEFDPNGGNLGYKRLTDTYVSWRPNAAVRLTLGKHSAPFTMDGQTSSKELIAIDRSALTNNMWFTEEYVPGLSLSGEKSGILYNVGVFSSGAKDRGFGDSNGGEFVLATVGHDFAGKLGANEALLRFDFVDNQPDPANSFTRPLERVQSVNFSYGQDRWGVRSDLSTAKGYPGQSDLWGLMLMPFYNLSDRLQLVARYTYLDSDDANGIRFGRYERALEAGRGDEYREIYFGINHYWHGHKLKIQSGVQYVDMDDLAADGGAYTGWAWTTGFRVSW